ncbi:FeoA family protein [Clostridium sp. Cult3]|uniref:FeoA family protein n=1 Tax=Clostridium sp. Cult3 TaxID=2079004 RepID=UPI001F3BACB1|nr:FeoA family protein [Clostridium sp. Cult3]MCF6461707.1 ferrous iron transport protein A [Clostridium sp. Cult3]
MEKNFLTLNQLPIGSQSKVKQLVSDGSTRRRMLDLGLIHDTTIKSLIKSPAGDPVAYEIRGAVIALRSEESSQILVELIHQ